MMKRFLPILAVLLVVAGTVVVPRPSHAQLFGESDEEKAARQKHEDDQDAQISQLTQRIGTLEDRVQSLTDSLARATGDNEVLTHRLDELTQQLDRAQKDFSYRLCMMSAQELGVDASGNSGLNCAAAGTASASTDAPPSVQPGGVTPSSPPSSGPPVALGPAPAAQPLPPPPQPSGTARFDAAMNLLAKAQYDEAKAAFRDYADANSDDADFGSQAVYWVGHIDYVQRNYADAVNAFAEEIKKYPDAARTPDSILELGQSLFAMGRKPEGCTTLAALQKKKYPQATDATLALADGARKAADCSQR